MRLVRRGLAGVLAVGTAAGATVAVAARETSPPAQNPGPPNVWIDTPLDGSPHPPGEIEVVAHLTDPGGVTTALVSVDGRTVANRAMGGETLATLRLTLSIETTGEHTIIVSSSKVRGVNASATILIIDALQAAPETTTTTTTTSTTTSSVPNTTLPTPALETAAPPTSPPTTAPPTSPPTVAPTRPAPTSPPPPQTSPPPTTTTTTTTVPPTTTTAPPPTTPPCTNGTPAMTGPSGSITETTPAVSWSYDGCPPDSFTVQIAADAGFTDVEASASVGGDSRTWQSTPLEACRTYWARVAAYFGRTPIWSRPIQFTIVGRSC